jgi:hypothetical protein
MSMGRAKYLFLVLGGYGNSKDVEMCIYCRLFVAGI